MTAFKTELASWPITEAGDLVVAIRTAEDIVEEEEEDEGEGKSDVLDIIVEGEAPMSVRRVTLVRNTLTDRSKTYDLVLS